ncbi:hypothetical protein ACFP3I_13575 [Chryseobacterium arachidis]
MQRHPFGLRAEQSGARNPKDIVKSRKQLLEKERTFDNGSLNV